MPTSTCATVSSSAMFTTCPLAGGALFAKDASGVVNQILGDWQMAGVFSAATGNYYTATDINNVSGSDCGGPSALLLTAQLESAIPTLSLAFRERCLTPAPLRTTTPSPELSPSEHSATPDATSSRARDTRPGTLLWSNSSRSREQKHLEFRAEFFNVLNHVNYLFGQFGAISAEPTPLELGQTGFGYPLAARAPRQIQFALKFYF